MSTYTFTTINENGDVDKIICDNKNQLFNTIPTLENRDLSVVDKKHNYKVSAIIHKDKTILVKLDYIRCIIYNKKAYIVTDNNLSSLIINFDEERFNDSIVNSIKDDNNKLKFKLKVLEEIFSHVANYFDEQVEKLSPNISTIRISIYESQPTINTRQLFEINNLLIDLQSRVKDIFELFEELLPENDDELKKDINDDSTNKKVSSFDDLVSNYIIRFEDSYKDLSDMVNTIDLVIRITDTTLDVKRNKIAILGVQLTVISIFLSIGNLVSSIFGMNLLNGLEKTVPSFPITIVCIIIITLISFLINKFVIHKIID